MVYLSNIVHPFIDIKGNAWGHSWVIGMCLHSIFCISCVEREPGITRLPVALYICSELLCQMHIVQRLCLKQ